MNDPLNEDNGHHNPPITTIISAIMNAHRRKAVVIDVIDVILMIDVIVVIGVKRSARLGKLHRTWLKVTGIPTRVVALVGVRRKSTLWPHRSSASMSGFHEQMRKDDTRRVLGGGYLLQGRYSP